MIEECTFAVDANSIAKRMWHAGGHDPENSMYAVYEFFSYLIRLDSTYSPQRVILAWDSPPYFRKDLYPRYKSNRPPSDANWLSQLGSIKKICTTAGVSQALWPNYEADDILATIANRSRNCTILSSDKDLLALVSTTTTLELLRHTKKEGTHRKRFNSRMDVKEFIGVFPEQIPEFKALAGDASDNIPGVTGIGNYRAVALLERFGTLQGIRDHAHCLVKKNDRPFAYAKNLVAEFDDALLYETLCTTVVIDDMPPDKGRSLNIREITSALEAMKNGIS